MVRLPGGGVFVIDAKCSLNAFLEAQDAVDEAGARGRLAAPRPERARATCRACRPRPIGTSSRRSPDFVAMFVPGDGFLAAALERAARPDDRGHGPAGDAGHAHHPVRPVQGGGLRLAGGGAGAKGAEKIADLGRELYKRLAVMGGHAPGLGKALEGAVGSTTHSSARWRARC